MSDKSNKKVAAQTPRRRSASYAEFDVIEPKRRKDGRLTKAERTKLKILQSAEQVFAAHGYENTTLDAVGEPVDLLGTAVLYHFKNKRVLYQETLKYVFRPLSKRITADFERTASLEEMLADISRAMVEYSVERPNAIKLFMREAAAGTPETLTIIGPMLGKALQTLFDAVGDQKKSTRVARVDPVLMVAMLIGVIGFYFSGFPTLMGDRLPYDPGDPERIEELRCSIGRFVELLLKSDDIR